MSKKNAPYYDDSGFGFVADTTLKSLHELVSRYGDAGFWGTFANAGIKFRYGPNTSSSQHPLSQTTNRTIFGLRAAGGILSLIEVISDQWLRRENERKRRDKIRELQQLKRDLVDVVFEIVADSQKLKAQLLAGDPESWAKINKQLLVQLEAYQGRYRNHYNRHLWYELQRDIYDGDEQLSSEQALEKSQKTTPRKRKALWQRILHALGDSVLGLIWGSGFVTGIAGLLSFNVATLAILIPAVVVGVLYAVLKVVGNLYSERKHDQIADKLDDEVTHICTTVKILRSFSQMKQVDVGDIPDDVNLVEMQHHQQQPQHEWRAKAVTRGIYFTAVTTVMGSGLVYSLNGLVNSFATVFNTTISIASSAFNFMLVGGIVFAMLHIGFKIALAVKAGIDSEREKIAQLNRHLEFQEQRAMRDKNLNALIDLSINDLLVKTLDNYFALSHTEQERYQKTSFKQIEAVLGKTMDEAKDSISYYRYLTFQLTQATSFEHANYLVKQLKVLQGETNSVLHDQGILATLPKKPMLIRRNEEGGLDHKGNLQRVISHFKKSYNFIYDIMFPVVIGFAIGSLFFTGPAYFAVIGVAIPLLLGLFIVNKVLERRREQRMEGYDQKLAVIGLRDQAVEYQKRLDLDHASQKKATVMPESPRWKKDYKSSSGIAHHHFFDHDWYELENDQVGMAYEGYGFDGSKEAVFNKTSKNL